MVLKYIVQARARDLAVIVITHNIFHAVPIADKFAILNRGHSIGTFTKTDISREQVLSMMAGKEDLDELETEIKELTYA